MGVTSLVPDDLARPPAGPLWRTPGLAVLFTASTTARLANESARVAVVLLVLARTGSPALAGAVVAGLTLPALITGPLLGAWLDRTHHRRTAFVTNQVLLPVTLVLLLVLTGHVPGVVVVLLTALAGITSPVLTGGFTGLIGPLVPEPMLRRAYGAESTSYNVAGVVGPSLAAGITAASSASAAVVVSAVLSGVALVAVLRVPMPAPLAAGPEGLLQAVWSGLRHLVTTPALRSVTVATTLSFMGIGAFPVVFPALAVDVGATAEASGLLFSGFALGALIGSLVVAARAPKMGPLRLALLGIAGLTALFVGIAEAPGLGVALALVVVAGAFEGPVLASTLTVRELYSPSTMRTQVVTTAASLKFGAAAAGAALGGHVVAVSDGRTGALLVAGCQGAGVLVGAIALGWPALRHRFAR
jgi:MFS family permease